jgi:hypothetical protein
MRSGALGSFTSRVNELRSALVQQALRLGSPEVINALKADPNYAEFVGVLSGGANDPNSIFNVLARQETEGLQNVDVGSNARNAFFSGFRLQDRKKVNEDFSGRRAGAVGDYNTFAGATAGDIAQARSDYEAAMNEALGLDTEAALSQEPQPSSTGASEGAAPGSPSQSRRQAARRIQRRRNRRR